MYSAQALLLTVVVAAVVPVACSTGARPADDGGPSDGGGDAATDNAGIPGWEVAWAVRAGSEGDDWAGCRGGIAALDDGQTLIAGRIAGPSIFGEGTANEISTGYYGDFEDAFLARYGADGTPEWVATMGGPGIDEVWGVAALPDESAYVAGRFEHDAVFGEGGPNETMLSSQGGWDLFVARFDAGGQLEWVEGAGGPGPDYGTDVSLLADGSALVTGMFEQEAVFGEGTEAEVELTSEAGSRDAFAAKYGPEGDLCWARRVATGPEDEDGMNGEGAAFPDGSFVVAGTYRGTVIVGEGDANETVLEPLDAESESVFVARYGPDETLAWVADLAVISDDEWNPGMSRLLDVEPDGEGGCFITGGFSETMVAGAGEPGETVLEASADKDMFVARLDSAGGLAWAMSAGGSDEPGGNGTQGFALDLAPSGLLAVSGRYEGELALGSGENGIVLPFEGDEDAVFAALDTETGALFWAFGKGGKHDDWATGVAAWGNESLFFCGCFEGVVDFGTSAEDAVTLTSVGDNNYPDIFVMRLDRTEPPD